MNKEYPNCIDEGCPFHGKAIKCFPQKDGCIATVPKALETALAFTEPNDVEKEWGWSVSTKLISEIEKQLTYPAHQMAIEQIILHLKKKILE